MRNSGNKAAYYRRLHNIRIMKAETHQHYIAIKNIPRNDRGSVAKTNMFILIGILKKVVKNNNGRLNKNGPDNKTLHR